MRVTGINNANVTMELEPHLGSVDMNIRIVSDYKHIAAINSKVSKAMQLHSGAADLFVAIGQAIAQLETD